MLFRIYILIVPLFLLINFSISSYSEEPMSDKQWESCISQIGKSSELSSSEKNILNQYLYEKNFSDEKRQNNFEILMKNSDFYGGYIANFDYIHFIGTPIILFKDSLCVERKDILVNRAKNDLFFIISISMFLSFFSLLNFIEKKFKIESSKAEYIFMISSLFILSLIWLLFFKINLFN